MYVASAGCMRGEEGERVVPCTAPGQFLQYKTINRFILPPKRFLAFQKFGKVHWKFGGGGRQVAKVSLQNRNIGKGSPTFINDQ